MNSLPQCGRLGKRCRITLVRTRSLRLVAANLVAAVALLSAFQARADPVATHEAVTMRLVADPVTADGLIRGAVVLDLKPGWKTYWIDPGEAGLSPAIAIDGASLATLLFPAPSRFEEAGILSTGYVDPVGIGFTATAGASGKLEATIAIGVCRTVCIPVTATLDLPIRTAGRPDALVDWTFASLPDAAGDRFTAILASDAPTLLVNVSGSLPGPGADIFAAGPEGWSFGPATRVGERRFSLPILSRRANAEPPVFRIVLADGETTAEALGVPVDTAGGGHRL